jgi:hypothetical protein
VRVLETKAREANEPDASPGRRAASKRGALHPDQEAAAAEIADALGAALGIDVTVKPSATGYRAELTFDDPAEALALARRLRRPRAVA